MPQAINKIIKIMIVSDIFLNSGWGLVAPVFAIFIMKNVAAGSAVEAAKIAGFASLTYWVTKSLFQIPIGKYLDKNHGEKDDLWFMVIGLFLAGLSPFGFILASRPWHIYFFEVAHGVGMAMALVSWCAVFTRHIDKGREGFEWGLESTTLGFAAGIAGAIGGVLAAFLGFTVIFILVGCFTLISAGLLLLIRKEIIEGGKVNGFVHRASPPFFIP